MAKMVKIQPKTQKHISCNSNDPYTPQMTIGDYIQLKLMQKCNFNPSLGCGGSVKIKRLIKLLKIWAEFDENLEKTPKTALYLNRAVFFAN